MKIKASSILIILLLMLFGIPNTWAQQFSLQGDAVAINTTTFRLTQNSKNNKGMITNLFPKDLTQDFELDFEANFGSNNGNGADGIAVVFSKACNPDLIDGAGIGAAGIPNSVIIEFDTYDNSILFFDRPENHITIFKNGLMDSANSIMDVANPVCALPDCSNIDDSLWKRIKIKWEFLSATSQRISVFFDGNLRVTSTRNHITDSFEGNTKVFYSLSAATGDETNLHRVRISDNSVISDVCAGNSITLTAPDLGTNYVWSKGSSTTNTLTYTPTASETVTCTYTDFCSVNRTISYQVTVLANPTEPTISATSPICSGTTAEFKVSGQVDTVVDFKINDGSNTTTTIPASGETTITQTNAKSTVVFKIEKLTLGTCSTTPTISKTVTISTAPVTSAIVAE